MKNFTEKLFNGIQLLLGTMLAVMIALVFLNVILRFFFNSGLVWSEEVSRYVFVYVIYIGAIVAMKENAHLGAYAVGVALEMAKRKKK